MPDGTRVPFAQASQGDGNRSWEIGSMGSRSSVHERRRSCFVGVLVPRPRFDPASTEGCSTRGFNGGGMADPQLNGGMIDPRFPGRMFVPRWVKCLGGKGAGESIESTPRGGPFRSCVEGVPQGAAGGSEAARADRSVPEDALPRSKGRRGIHVPSPHFTHKNGEKLGIQQCGASRFFPLGAPGALSAFRDKASRRVARLVPRTRSARIQ